MEFWASLIATPLKNCKEDDSLLPNRCIQLLQSPRLAPFAVVIPLVHYFIVYRVECLSVIWILSRLPCRAIPLSLPATVLRLPF